MPRLAKPLTDTEIKKAKSKENPYYLRDGGGLVLLITKTTKLWRIDYNIGEYRNTFTLGHYPDISLAEARIKKTKI